ncbi:MAG: hypothetical protein GXY83_07670 [Rhodopirellula sp.]|nr:hypothetical protein [Rhodopirellula sp.]
MTLRTAVFAIWCCCPMPTAIVPLASASEGWRSYEVYQPTITRHAVIDARSHAHKYNH